MLNRQQLNHFERNGVLRLDGAVPPSDIETVRAQVWDNLERRYPFRRGQPGTWTGQRLNGFHALDKSVCFEQVGSSVVCEALDDLLGDGNWQRPPRWGSLLVAFPESQGLWDVPTKSWHLDLPGSNSSERQCKIRLFTCVEPLGHGGGATLAIAGSHLLVQKLIRKKANKELSSAYIRAALIRTYPWIKSLCSGYESADRIARFMDVTTCVESAELRVVEMTCEPGDVYLVHPLMVHAPSTNCGEAPRIVLSTFIYGP